MTGVWQSAIGSIGNRKHKKGSKKKVGFDTCVVGPLGLGS
jgi:hypothetical protein